MSSIAKNISLFFSDLDSVISLSYLSMTITFCVIIVFIVLLMRSQKADKSRARQLDDVLFRLKNAVDFHTIQIFTLQDRRFSERSDFI